MLTQSGVSAMEIVIAAISSDAIAITDDVRQRDEDRLHVQASEGILAGRHLLFNKPVTPEPLVKPIRPAVALDKATQDTITPASPPVATSLAAIGE